MKNRQKTCTNNQGFLLPGYLKPYLDAFTKALFNKGYTVLTIGAYYDSVAHFGTWLQKKQVSLKEINDSTIAAFAKHHCRCPGGRRIKKISCKYVKRVRCFVFYLHQQGILVLKENISKASLPPLLIKFKNSLKCCGLSVVTIGHYERSISKLLPSLGKDPHSYNAALIRRVICGAAKQCSISEIKKLTTALKAYLRFLAVEGASRPDLDGAVPIVAQWRLSSLPKYITENEVERVIASCNIDTKQGLRDRAILLLLARLALRAGDVINMLIKDINWLEGTLRVRGKGRREVLLPLPQEVGDALLLYLEQARPQVSIDHIFLCLNAPCRPFRFSNNISDIVRAGLFRAGITNPPSHGASLLRHSAATSMLRNGASLDSVSAVLRHHSLDMTAYYAKVDVRMLIQITQPWPEGAPC